jgi:hypothetical protein
MAGTTPLEEFCRWIANASRLKLSLNGASGSLPALYVGARPLTFNRAVVSHVAVDGGGPASYYRKKRREWALQILTFGESEIGTLEEATRMCEYLHGKTGHDIGASWVSTVTAVATPQSLGRNPDRLATYSTNFVIQLEKE